MNIHKAIQILEDLQTNLPQHPPADRRDAVRLGIEALEEVIRARNGFPALDGELLPGETEE